MKRGGWVHEQRCHGGSHREPEESDDQERRVTGLHALEVFEFLLGEREPLVEEEVPQVRDEETHRNKHVVEANIEVRER